MELSLKQTQNAEFYFELKITEGNFEGRLTYRTKRKNIFKIAKVF